MNNQEGKIKSELNNVNSNELLFYYSSIKTNIFKVSRNNINNPGSKLCLSDVIKNINVKLFRKTIH